MPRRTPALDNAPNPFAPIEYTLSFLLYLCVGLMALGLTLVAAQAVVGRDFGVSVLGFNDPACVTADIGAIGVIGALGDDNETEQPFLTTRGSMQPATYTLCVEHPSLAEQVAASLAGGLDWLALVGASLLVRRVVRTSRTRGVFSATTAHNVRFTGWFLIMTSLLLPLGSRLGNGVVAAAASTESDWSSLLTQNPQPAWTLLLTGLAVLTFARILRLAVPLREESELTV